MIKFIPMLLTIWTRAKNLSGAMSSQTTQAQEAAVLALCGIIAAVGYFVPALAPDNVAQGAVLFLLAIVSPLLSRMLGKKEPEPLPFDVGVPNVVLEDRIKLADTFMAYVFHSDGSWRPFVGTGLDALHGGYEFACDAENWIWELTSATKTDKQRPVLKGTTEQSNTAMKLAIAAIKARLAEIRAQKDS
jgi:hypothetical protein